MSYDLHFRTRGAPLDPGKVEDYFRARSWLEKYRSSRHTDLVVLDYKSVPPDLAAFITPLAAASPKIDGIPFDKVLDRELAEKARSKRVGS